MSLDAIFIRFYKILSLRYTSPTADCVQDMVYKRRELLFGTQYDGNKVKGTEKRLIKKVKVVKLKARLHFTVPPPPPPPKNANLFRFTNCRPAASSVHYTTSCKHSLALPRMGEIIA